MIMPVRQFPQAPNSPTITSKAILSGADWIYYVSHDEDGVWQFHGYGGPAPEAAAAVVALSTIVALDASVSSLSTLPAGWCAWRNSPSSAWQRAARATQP